MPEQPQPSGYTRKRESAHIKDTARRSLDEHVNRGSTHHLDDWGPNGGHEWPDWHHQRWEYVAAHF